MQSRVWSSALRGGGSVIAPMSQVSAAVAVLYDWDMRRLTD